MKIVINICYGGFGLSEAALKRYAEIKGIKGEVYEYDIARNAPALIQVLEELEELSQGKHAALKIVQIPDDVVWTINNYDGHEWVAEVHRTWH